MLRPGPGFAILCGYCLIDLSLICEHRCTLRIWFLFTLSRHYWLLICRETMSLNCRQNETANQLVLLRQCQAHRNFKNSYLSITEAGIGVKGQKSAPADIWNLHLQTFIPKHNPDTLSDYSRGLGWCVGIRVCTCRFVSLHIIQSYY